MFRILRCLQMWYWSIRLDVLLRSMSMGELYDLTPAGSTSISKREAMRIALLHFYPIGKVANMCDNQVIHTYLILAKRGQIVP